MYLYQLATNFDFWKQSQGQLLNYSPTLLMI